MLLIVAAMSVLYVRRMVKMGEAAGDLRDRGRRRGRAPRSFRGPRPIRRQRRRRLRRMAWNVVGLAVFVVLVFPVFWMISTAFKPDTEINSFTPTGSRRSRRCEHFRDAIARPYFWEAVKNSLIVVGAVVALVDGRRLPRGRRAREVPLHGQQALRRPRDRDPHAPAGRARDPALRRARQVPPDEPPLGLVSHAPRDPAAVRRVDASRLHHGHPEGARGGGDGRRLEPARRLHADPASARRSGARGDLGLRLHHELERVHLRQRHPHGPAEPDAHRLALVLLRDEPRRPTGVGSWPPRR